MNELMTKVAVYGSLREGLHNHPLLHGSKKLGLTKTKPEWTMLSLGSYPAAMPSGETALTLEIYEVDAEVFAGLDMLEGYPSFYDRKKIDTEFGEAWIYFIEDAEGYSNTYVPSGDWTDVMSVACDC